MNKPKATHDVMMKTGEYTDSNGEKKNRYLKIGTCFETEKPNGGSARSIKLDALPLPNNKDGSCWLSLFEIKSKQ